MQTLKTHTHSQLHSPKFSVPLDRGNDRLQITQHYDILLNAKVLASLGERLK